MAFAGDALICLFAPRPEDHGDTSRCCLRAIHCGNQLKMLQTATLSAHIAIDYGSARLSFVGGYQKNWAYVFDGECLANLSDCVGDAQVQELVVSWMVSQQLENCNSSDLELFTLQQLSSGNYLVNTSPKHLESLEVDLNVQTMKFLMAGQFRDEYMKCTNTELLSFIPQPVLANLQYFENGSVLKKIVYQNSELRQVTCIFLKLDSYTAGYPLHDLQNCFVNWQEIILRLGGFIRQFVVDDKGCVLIALWGVPTASHVNDAIRAITAASTISLFCKKHDIHVSMGVTTGDVYCGMIGSQSRCDYAAVGPSINMAARLMAGAKGRIWMDEHTHSCIQSSHCNWFLRLPLMTLKGNTASIQVYEFDDEKFRSQGSTSPSLLLGENSVSVLTLDSQQADSKISLASSTIEKLSKAINHIMEWKGMVYLAEPHPVSDVTPRAYIEDNSFEVIQVTGTAGTGKTEVGNQLKELCHVKGIRTIFLTLSEIDFLKEYHVLRQIFVKLVGEEKYFDLATQKEIVTSLFYKTFPGTNSSQYLKQRFESVKLILGLDWYPENLLPQRSRLSQLIIKSPSSRSRSSAEPVEEEDHAGVALQLFVNLLSVQPLTIIIDEAQYVDNSTWIVLIEMINQLRAPVLILFTMTEPHQSLDDVRALHGGAAADGNGSIPFLHRSPTLSNQLKLQKRISHLDPLAANHHAHCLSQRLNFLQRLSIPCPVQIKLHGLTKRQVRAILESSLKFENINFRLVNIVAEICEGNAYWCKVLTEFIVEYGEELFCNTFCPVEPNSVKFSLTSKRSTLSMSPQRALQQSDDSKRSRGNIIGALMDEEISASMSVSRENVNTAADNVLYRLITTLMDRLTYQERETLKYASVCGTKFNSDLLRLVIPPNIDQFDDILSSLKHKKFISSSSGSMNCSFISIRMRDIIYSLIPSSDASRIHYLVAKNMEVFYEHSLESFYEVLAFHYAMTSLNHFQFVVTDEHETRNYFHNPPAGSDGETPKSMIMPADISKKSYQYSYLAAKFLYRLEEYPKALEYIRYATQDDALALLGDAYRQSVVRFLTHWNTECCWHLDQEDTASAPGLRDYTMHLHVKEILSAIDHG